jgi:hypothetical protein
MQGHEKQIVNESNQILTQKLHQYLKIQCTKATGSRWALFFHILSNTFVYSFLSLGLSHAHSRVENCK